MCTTRWTIELEWLYWISESIAKLARGVSMIDGGSGIELRDKCVEYGWLAKVRRSVLSCAWSVAVPMLKRSFNNYFNAIKTVSSLRQLRKPQLSVCPPRKGTVFQTFFQLRPVSQKKKKLRLSDGPATQRESSPRLCKIYASARRL